MLWSPQRFREHAFRATLAIAVLFASWLLSTWVAHSVVANMYHDTSWPELNRLLEHKDRHPLAYYTAKADVAVVGMHVLLVGAAALFITYGMESAWLYLGILLIGDMIFGVLSERYGGLSNIRVDGSIPEMFQYLKEGLAGFFFLRIFLVTRQSLYAGIALLFAFLLVDDSLRYHERAGVWLAGLVDLSPLADRLGVRTVDVGELASVVPPAAVFGALLMWGYWTANKEGRKVGIWVAFGVGLLGLFGVIIDLTDRLPSVIEFRKTIAFVEDFGEMVIMSGLAAFAASVMWRTEARVSTVVRTPRT